MNEVKLTHVSNAGFLIESGGYRILIDGMVQPDGSPYLPMSDMLASIVLLGEKIDLALFTHEHSDHFNEKLVREYMSGKDTVIISSASVADMLSDDPELSDFTVEAMDFVDENVRVKPFVMTHSGSEHRNIENVGFLVSIADKTIFHAGDAKTVDRNFKKLYNQKMDVAILPYPFLLQNAGRKIISKMAGCDRFIITHIPESSKGGDGIVANISREIEKLEIKSEIILMHSLGDSLEI